MKIKSKSKEKIIKTFLNLSASEDIGEIGTSNIIAVSGVSRGTFYNHFKNKKDILEYIEKMMCKSIDEVFRKVDQNDENYIDELMDEIFPIIYNDREYNKVLYLYYQSEFFDFITERYSKYFSGLFKNYNKKIANWPQYFTIQYFFRMMLNIILLWLSEPFPVDPDEFKYIFKELMNTSIADICGIEI